MTTAIDILWELAIDENNYESEYDGRNYVYCCYCNSEVGHDSDCLMLRAREALGEEWELYLDKQFEQKMNDAKKLKKDAQLARKKKKEATCKLCGYYVGSKENLDSHMHSKRCLKLQKTK